MLATTATEPSRTPTNRSLWILIASLGAAVAVLGGVLLGQSMQSAAAPTAAVQSVAPQAQAGLVPLAPDDATHGDRATAGAARDTSTKPGESSGQVRVPASSVAAPPVAAHRLPPVQAPVCRDCGTVISVAKVERAMPASGVGAVAGGVVGGLVGNQVGGGSGRAVATVVGALGGGWAGNAVEKRVRTTTRYEVRVRMADGSVRSLDQAAPVATGSAVLVQNGVAQARSSGAGS